MCSSDLAMSDRCGEQMEKLRSFMFAHVYYNSSVKKNEDLAMVEKVILSLYAYYAGHPDQLPEERRDMIEAFGVLDVVKDHVAGMTDRYAIHTYQALFP